MYSVNDTYNFSSAYMIIAEHLDDTKIVFKDFLNEGYQLVSEKQSKIDEKLKTIESEDNEEAQIYYQHEYEPLRLKYHDLRNTFLYAGISFLYSQFETSFLNIAKNTQDLYQSKNSIEQYKHKCKKLNRGISRFKNYLIDTYRLNLIDLEKDWELIDNFRKIRNYYVHRNRTITKDKKLIEHFKSEPKLNFNDGYIEITKEYLVDISDVLFRYLHVIMERLYENNKTKKV